MSTNLTLSMAPDAIKARMNYAQALAASGLIPQHFQRNPANVLVAIETGTALNIPAIQALTGIAVINGRATITADLMAAVVRKAGHKLRIEEHGGAVTASLIRADDPDFTYTATWDKAKAEQAGLWGRKGPWVQYPEQMLRARAITEVCRQGASDALFGIVYAPEDLGATVDEDGNVIDDNHADMDVQQPPVVAHDVEPLVTVDQQAQIGALITQLQVTDEQMEYAAGWASSGRTTNLWDLTQAEADELLGYMLSRVHPDAPEAEAGEDAVQETLIADDEEVGE